MTVQDDVDAGIAGGGCPAAGRLVTPTGCPVSELARSFDPFGGAYQADPGAALRGARAEEPVFYSPLIDYWVVTRYEDVKAVFKNPGVFSAAVALEQITPLSDDAIDILDGYDFSPSPIIVNEDPPNHTERRRAIMPPFLPNAVERLAPRMTELINDYIDRFVARGHADLVDDLFYEVPCIIALMFLGVPDEDIETCRHFSMQQTLFTWGRPPAEEQNEVADGMGQFWQFAGGLVEKLKDRPDPGEGWVPHTIKMHREDPERFTDADLQSITMSGLLAAHETTTNASGNAIRALLENRTAWDRLCADPALINHAVEECLRYDGSVAAWRRITTEDTSVGGVAIPAESRLLVVLSSANRDESELPDPDTFDLDRPNSRKHMAFGIGPHICLGATLARREMQIFIGELARRLPHMRLAPDQEFTYLPNTSFRGPRHLFVEWDPTANPVPADRP